MKFKSSDLIKLRSSYSLKWTIAFLILAALSGCGSKKEQTKVQDQNPNLNYQIGLEWNREPLNPVGNLPYQIFNMNRAYFGDVGVGVYLGNFGGRHIGMTVAHLYPDLQSCKDEVSFLIQDADQYNYYPCLGWSFKLVDNDIIFFEINPDVGNMSLLVPVEISKKSEVLNQNALNEKLKFITFERNLSDQTAELFADMSEECRVLSLNSKHIVDPDISDSRMITSWSVAMGCDAKHGDSGAPVYDLDMKLKGLLWTGKYPKNHLSRSLIPSTEENLWEDYNYFVPVEKIKEELGGLKIDPQVKAEDQELISNIFDIF